MTDAYDRRVRAFDCQAAAAAAVAEYLDGADREFVLDARNWGDADEWWRYSRSKKATVVHTASRLLETDGGPRLSNVIDRLPKFPEGSWEADPREWRVSRL